MEQHNHHSYEIIHGEIPINELLDALDYNQDQSDEHIKRTNERINTLIEALLTLELDSAARFALLELLAR